MKSRLFDDRCIEHNLRVLFHREPKKIDKKEIRNRLELFSKTEFVSNDPIFLRLLQRLNEEESEEQPLRKACEVLAKPELRKVKSLLCELDLEPELARLKTSI